VQALSLLGEAAFIDLMFEVKCDQQCLQEAQQKDRDKRRQDSPEQDVHPPRHAEFELSDQRAPETQKSKNEYSQDGWTVAGLDGFEVEAADFAPVAEIEQIGEELAFAATRAAAIQSGDKRRNGLAGAGHGSERKPSLWC
jgi:hypothetical protein